MNQYRDSKNNRKGNKNVKNKSHKIFNKIDCSKDKDRNVLQKNTKRKEIEEPDNPLNDLEIIRAMGMDKCSSCNILYPLYLNRCPQCINE